MSIETYQFNLPITPGAIPPVLHLSQYDSGRTFTAILRDDANVPFELDSGATAVIKGRNAAGIAWQQDCTVSGANVTFTPSGAATDQFGVMPVTIEITESEEVISPLCVIFNIQKAGYTNEEAVLSPDFETAIQAAVAQAISEGGLGFSDEFKEALLVCFEQVAWKTTNAQPYISALETALYPEVHLSSITAAYEQDRPIHPDSSMTEIKYDLVVTANYSDGSSEVLSDSDYEVSGALNIGTSALTVTYETKTAEIEVTVTGYTYSLASGTHTFSTTNDTIEISNGNHVKMHLANLDDTYHANIFNLSSLNLNTAVSYFRQTTPTNNGAVNNLSNTWFTIPANASVVFEVLNFTPSATELFRGSGSRQFVINIRKTNTSSSAISTGLGFSSPTDFNAKTEQTITDQTACSCLFVYSDYTKAVDVEFDIRLTVNGVRWL